MNFIAGKQTVTNTIYVGQLPEKVEESDLKKLFPKSTKIELIAPKTSPKGVRPGFAFVTFQLSRSTSQFMSNRPHLIKGQEVFVKRALPRSTSSIPLNNPGISPITTISDVYLTPNEQLSLRNSSQSSLSSTLNNMMETSSMSSLTMLQQQSSTTKSSPIQSHSNLLSAYIENKHDLLTNEISPIRSNLHSELRNDEGKHTQTESMRSNDAAVNTGKFNFHFLDLKQK